MVQNNFKEYKSLRDIIKLEPWKEKREHKKILINKIEQNQIQQINCNGITNKNTVRIMSGSER